MRRSALLLAAIGVAAGGSALAQECLVRRPPTPTKATHIIVRFSNPDGGARPCHGSATTPNGQPPNEYQMSNADCDRLKRLGDWAVQQDNGWGDGGAP